jgi:hypothetical protein
MKEVKRMVFVEEYNMIVFLLQNGTIVAPVASPPSGRLHKEVIRYYTKAEAIKSAEEMGVSNEDMKYVEGLFDKAQKYFSAGDMER